MASILDKAEKPGPRPVVVTILGDAGQGKAQPVWAKVQTPEGPVDIGSIKEGDFVIGSNGKPTKVEGVYPQGEKETYEVIFRDGSKTWCCDEHLWSVDTGKARKVASLRDIIDSGLYKGGTQYKYRVPFCDPVEYTEVDHLISPYTMGVLLGDGYIGGNGVYFSTSDMDVDIKDRVDGHLQDGMWLRCNLLPACPQYRINDCTKRGNRYASEIRRLGVNKKSLTKFIPGEYLYDSVQNRVELLSALMDTDGTTKNGRTSFCSGSERLAKDVCTLVQGLGGMAIMNSYDRESKGISYVVNVRTSFNPFSCKRKSEAWIPCKQNNPRRGIKSAEKIGVDEHVCIKVEAEDSLYLTDEYIVTHNTTLAAAFPKPIFIRAEDGIQGVPSNMSPDALPTLNKVDDLWEQLNALCKEDHGYKTVVIDSITQLEQMFVQHVIESDPKKPRTINQANGGYGAGWQAVGGMHQRVRKAASILVNKGVHVVFLAHADTSTIEPPDGEPYTRYDLRLNKRSVAPYTDNVDVVGYLRLQTYTTGDGERKQAVSDGSRVLVTYSTPSNISKNRYQITDDLPVAMGTNPLAAYIPSLKEGTK